LGCVKSIKMKLFDLLKKAEKKEQLTENQLMKLLFSNAMFNNPIVDVLDSHSAVKRGYMYNHIIFSIINRIAGAVAGVPFNVYRVMNEKGRQLYNSSKKAGMYGEAIMYKSLSYEPATDNEVERLIKEPNPQQRLNDLIVELITFYLITGNGYLYGLRRATGDKGFARLYTMPANLVNIIFGNYLEPVKGYRIEYIDGIIPNDDVLHIKNVNPNYDTYGSWVYGLSPIQAAGTLTSMSNYAYTTQLSNFQTYGVRGILGGEGENWTMEQVQRVKDMWNGIVNGSKGDIIVTGAPMKWTNIGLSPVDMDIIEQQKLTLRDLCMIYNVPSQLFGDSEHSTYNNIREARKAMITDAVIPVLEKVKDGLNRFLCKGTDLYIDYDLQAFAELQDDMSVQVAALSQAWWLTPNEKRVAMGKLPIESVTMDDVLIPSGYIPLVDYEMQDNTVNDDEEL